MTHVYKYQTLSPNHQLLIGILLALFQARTMESIVTKDDNVDTTFCILQFHIVEVEVPWYIGLIS